MKKLILAAVTALAFSATALAADTSVYTGTKEAQANISPKQALQLLQQGNQRFVANLRHNRNLSIAREQTSQAGQYPFAFVLSCVDSRSVPDLTFDQGLGDIFVGRVAGNVVNSDMLGSMEFAAKFAGVKLIVVMGHTACGAVQGACMGVESGNLTGLVKQIEPAVAEVEKKTGDKNCKDPKLVNEIAKQNVLDTMQNIYQDSPTLKEMADKNQIEIVGAMHDLATGKVVFFDRKGQTISS